jgi:hypothetical protein
MRYDFQMRFCRALLVSVLLACPHAAIAAEPPALARARMQYNAGSYDSAIESATLVRGNRQYADAASLVIGRSYLERYRLNAEPDDLVRARAALAGVRDAALSPRDQVDLLIGLGQTLFFAEQFGAGAELFERALAHAAMLSPPDRRRLLDWWASAMEREAQARPLESRAVVFNRIVVRMEEELAIDAASPVANYWLAAAARGEGDLERAWDAAVAAWVVSVVTPETTQSLRTDIERLVTEALIPERARTRAQREDYGTALRVEWERVKENWKQ